MRKTEAQQAQETYAIEALIGDLKDISDDAVLMAIEAVIEARPNMKANALQAFAHRISGMAWDMQRESR